MAPRACSLFLCLLAVLPACASGAEPDTLGLTFGDGAVSTQAMPSENPSDSGTTGGDADTGGTASSVEEGPGPGSVDAGDGGSCGNGRIDGADECDGTDLGGADCISAGLAGGTLACTEQCTLDTSGCVDTVCGDGMLQTGEACDCAGSACTIAQLDNQVCTGLAAPTGGNYSGGMLACTAQCSFDASGCTACGDAVVDAGEDCDGANLNGATCISQGFDTGTLSCGATCAFETAACVDYVCGNGTCDPNEDSCSCPADCPDDPNTCGDPCQCGGSGGNCYCDLDCLSFGDCCINGPC